MKKIMIGILAIIPVIIMMVIALVSTILVVSAHIGVDKITLNFKDDSLSILELEMNAGKMLDDCYEFDLNDYFNVNIYPSKASREFTWSLAEVDYLDNDYKQKYDDYIAFKDDPGFTGSVVYPAAMFAVIDHRGNLFKDPETGSYIEAEESESGRLIVSSYCNVRIKVQAETKSDMQIVSIIGFDINKLTLHSKSDGDVKIGDSILLTSGFQPMESKVELILWESDNEAVATVDKNGIVTAKSVGAAKIKAKALIYSHINETGVYAAEDFVESGEFTVTVKDTSSVYGDVYYTHLDTLNIADLGLINPRNPKGMTVYGDSLINITSGATVETDNGIFTVYTCGADEIEIASSGLINYDGTINTPFILSAGELPLSLNARWKSFDRAGAPAVVWSSSDDNVATVDNDGNVNGLISGIITIKASLNGSTAEVLLRVEKKVVNLMMRTSNESLAVGIARETVFASKKFDNSKPGGLTANQIEIKIARPIAPSQYATEEEKDLYYSAFEFTVDAASADLAYFETNRNILVFKPENIKGKTVITITVKVRFPKYENPEMEKYYQKSVEITVTDGIEVNNAEEFDKIIYDVYQPIYDANKVSEQTQPYCDLVLNDSIEYKNNAKGKHKIRGDLYGNGFILSPSAPLSSTWETDIFIAESNTTVSNVQIRIGEIDASGEITSQETFALKGTCLVFEGEEGKSHLTGCRVEYSIFENGIQLLELRSSDVTIEGSIFRNCSQAAIVILTEILEVEATQEEQNAEGYTQEFYASYSHVVMKNCIMSNLIGASLFFRYSRYSQMGGGLNKPRPDYQDYIARGENSTFTQQGFLDIYNWQDVYNFQMFDAGDDTINSLISSQLGEAMMSPSLKNYVMSYKNVHYLHMGIISFGMNDKMSFEKSCLEPTFEDKRFAILSTDELIANMPELIKQVLGPMFKDNTGYMYLYDNKNPDILPDSKVPYNATNKIINKLHGIY